MPTLALDLLDFLMILNVEDILINQPFEDAIEDELAFECGFEVSICFFDEMALFHLCEFV